MSTTIIEGLKGSQVRQFSVFLHNRVGALLEVVKLLHAQNVVILALSIVDSSESAIGRMVVSNPDSLVRLFLKHDIPYSECEIILIELNEGPGDLSRILSALLMAEVNVYFSYALLIRPRGLAVLAMHLDDNECATHVLHGEGFKTLSQDDLSR